MAHIESKKIKLLIAGQCWGEWQKYQNIINKYDLQKRVILKIELIPEYDVEKLFVASDLMLLPYKYFSAQSGVGALAANFDIPMIVSNTGGLTDFIHDTNCVFEVNNFVELAETIKKVLSQKGLYDKLVADIQISKKHLCWEEIIKKTREIYGGLT